MQRLILIALPSGDFVFKQFPILNPAIQALTAEDADFDLGHVEPTGMLWLVAKHHPAK